MNSSRLIHLLYVPTLHCNLACSYCYLGAQTHSKTHLQDQARSVETLTTVLSKMKSENIIPFNLSLHGGEVSTLHPSVLAELFQLIESHYRDNQELLQAHGFHKQHPHIKTNLFNFHQLEELFIQHQVSVSASIDLPLEFHHKHRVRKNGESSLDQTLDNLRRLAQYPHSKKISCTLTQEHLQNLDDFVADIWYLHREIGFDMNYFNIMFAFNSRLNTEAKAQEFPELSSNQQVQLFHHLQKEFQDTELAHGLEHHWFEEFTPSFCTNSVNCGEKFYLLQSDGSVYSCVRGQGLPEFYYGNFLQENLVSVLTRGANQIKQIHESLGIDSCQSCVDLSKCNTGCPVVKFHSQKKKSYTCELQKEIYLKDSERYPRPSPAQQKQYLQHYLSRIHPMQSLAQNSPQVWNEIHLPNDLGHPQNTLAALIENDKNLVSLYGENLWVLELGEEWLPLRSPQLKSQAEAMVYEKGEVFKIHFRAELWAQACAEPIQNTLYIQMLRDSAVVYGDEKRTKQEHLFTHQVYKNHIHTSSTLGAEWLCFDLQKLIELHADLYQKGVLNNLFFCTSALRDYHYQKQKSNAFYHIQAINLPFPNVEFYYLDSEEK